MREFTDERGAVWVADAREEETPRHHGRWYLVFHEVDAPDAALPMPEVRWQTSATAARSCFSGSTPFTAMPGGTR